MSNHPSGVTEEQYADAFTSINRGVNLLHMQIDLHKHKAGKYHVSWDAKSNLTVYKIIPSTNSFSPPNKLVPEKTKIHIHNLVQEIYERLYHRAQKRRC
jgi:hypothetical protein